MHTVCGYSICVAKAACKYWMEPDMSRFPQCLDSLTVMWSLSCWLCYCVPNPPVPCLWFYCGQARLREWPCSAVPCGLRCYLLQVGAAAFVSSSVVFLAWLNVPTNISPNDATKALYGPVYFVANPVTVYFAVSHAMGVSGVGPYWGEHSNLLESH